MGRWDLPNPSKATSVYGVQNPVEDVNKPQPVNTDLIVARNIFDPERGEGQSRQVAENSSAFQRVKGLVLIGTAILGDNRFAILQDSSARTGPSSAPQPSQVMRVKVGDTVEGFRLAEVTDKKVVFTKGASRVEVTLDYFRKIEPVETKPPQPPGARPPVPGSSSPGTPRGTGAPSTSGATAAPPAPQTATEPPAPGQQAGPAKPAVPRVLPNLPRRDRLPTPAGPETQAPSPAPAEP